jgi:hypothetical protein
MKIYMKNLVILLTLLCCATASFAQILVLSGHIAGGLAGDPVELNLPFSETYYKDNSVVALLYDKGDFGFVVKGDHPALYLIVFRDSLKQWVLLCPGRPLHIEIKPDPIDRNVHF